MRVLISAFILLCTISYSKAQGFSEDAIGMRYKQVLFGLNDSESFNNLKNTKPLFLNIAFFETRIAFVKIVYSIPTEIWYDFQNDTCVSITYKIEKKNDSKRQFDIKYLGYKQLSDSIFVLKDKKKSYTCRRYTKTNIKNFIYYKIEKN